MARASLDQIRSEAMSVLDVWKANPQFQLADLSSNGMETLFNEFEALRRKESVQSNDLENTRMDMEAKAEKIREANNRARAGMQGFFGRNSNQYSLAGGTRLMDRKAPRRAATSPVTTVDGFETAK